MKKELSIVDGHLHLWKPSEISYPWLSDFPKINRDYGIQDYQEATSQLSIDKMVFVQCECLTEQFQTEINFITESAKVDSRLKAIVCWYPLHDRNAVDNIETQLQNKLIKGIRCLELATTSLYTDDSFARSVAGLVNHQLSFDLCCQASQLKNAIQLVQRCPDTWFILDHAGKPAAPLVSKSKWRDDIRELSMHPQVYCKLSGLVPEAQDQKWSPRDIAAYVEVALKWFGIDRVVFGSDWPVVNLSSSVTQWVSTLTEICGDLGDENADKIFNSNACRFYRI